MMAWSTGFISDGRRVTEHLEDVLEQNGALGFVQLRSVGASKPFGRCVFDCDLDLSARGSNSAGV
jgi:hypothetical protein